MADQGTADVGRYQAIKLKDLGLKDVIIEHAGDLAAAVTDVGSGDREIVVPDGITISANLTVPANVTLSVRRDARVTIASGVTLTVNGEFSAPRGRVFFGDGSVVLAGGGDVFPEWWGAKGDGTTDSSTAVKNCVAAVRAGSTVKFRAGGVYLIDGTTDSGGGYPIGGSDVVIDARGAQIKKGSTSAGRLFQGAGLSRLRFIGGDWDLNRSAGSDGDNSAVFVGYRCDDCGFEGMSIHDSTENALLFRNCGRIAVRACTIKHIHNIGIEFFNYSDSNYTSNSFPSATAPDLEGGHRITDCSFIGIDDSSGAAENGCGVSGVSEDTNQPFDHVSVANNMFRDCRRGIWFEMTGDGTADGISIIGNTIVGDVAGAATYECKHGIGVSSCSNVVIKGNTIHNAGNFDPSGESVTVTSAIHVTSNATVQATKVVVEGNTILDDGSGNVTDYGIYVNRVTDCMVSNNLISGCSSEQLFINSSSSLVSNLHCQANQGAETERSWGQPILMQFGRDNVEGGVLYLYPTVGTETEICSPARGKLVGATIKLSTAILDNSMTFTPTVDGNEVGDLTIVCNSSSNTVQGVIKGSREVLDNADVQFLSKLRWKVVAPNVNPATIDVTGTLIIDAGWKPPV